MPYREYQSKTVKNAKLKDKLRLLRFIEERNLYEESLFEFVKAAWSSIDSAEFKSNFAIEALCDHLECVTRGIAPRFLANLPPRTGKTAICSICWPAWTWIQSKRAFLSGPQVRFLCGSYNSALSLTHANTMRRLILSPWYQKYWGDRFDLSQDQNSKSNFSNTKGGARLSTSVGGSLLGLGGDVICFPYDEVVQTEDGPKQIGDLVEGRSQARVWSFDTTTGRTALKPIVGWHQNPGSIIVKVHLSDGTAFRCTPDHRIWTRDGWMPAVMLSSKDVLPGFSKNDAIPGRPILADGAKENLLGLSKVDPAFDDDPRLASDAAKGGNAVVGEPGDRFPLFLDLVGHVDLTYCLTVADYNTFVVSSGNVIVSNCLDDPHNAETEKVIETDADRRKVASWFQEIRSTRLNDPKQTAIVVGMQRLHESDLSGVILDSDDEEWVHLMVPMEMDESRRCKTIVLPQYECEGEPQPWTDPRTKDGELMWPERFGRREVERMKGIMGPYLSSGRLQQAPVPKGGGIIMRDWWQLWDEQEARRYGLKWNGAIKEFPPFELVVGSLDTSYGEKQENDFNAMTVWGIWIDRNRNRRAMLMFAWNKRLKLNGKVIAQLPNEANVNYMARQKEEWGLIEWVADTCKRYDVQRMLIEDKTRGRDVANEINRLYARENWGVELVNPVKDKVSRTHSVVPLFTDNVVWAPNMKWAEAVITQCATFPKGAHDDMVDTCTMLLIWARENGILSRADEMSAALEDEMRPKRQDTSIAQQYGV